jgi:hypothetical protein
VAFDNGGRFISSVDPPSILPHFSEIWGLRLRFASAIVLARKGLHCDLGLFSLKSGHKDSSQKEGELVLA